MSCGIRPIKCLGTYIQNVEVSDPSGSRSVPSGRET